MVDVHPVTVAAIIMKKEDVSDRDILFILRDLANHAEATTL
ncbi:hypothetical protein ACFPA1_07630 [Neobacillus sp. GCM10023253]